MISTPKNKTIDLKNSNGYVVFITKNDNKIYKLNIQDMSEDSPMLDFILNNEPGDSFKELSPNIFIKLIDKKIDLKYKSFPVDNGTLVETIDFNCPNKSGKLSTNRLNYIYYYLPEEKYTYGTISNQLLRFSKKYILEPTKYHQDLFNKYVNVFNKYIIKLLNNKNDTYVICCAPSHEASDVNYNTMSCVIKAVKKKYFIDFFVDGSNVITRKYTVSKLSLNKEKRTLEKQLDSIEIRHPELIKNKRVLLIDDFYTSGVTMEACKRLLLFNGAKEVIMFSFAKTRDLRW